MTTTDEKEPYDIWAENVMAYNPFDGDFGSPQDRCLRDRLVTARKGKSVCHICGSDIVPGTIIRSRSDIIEGEILSYRWCNECCNAMALSWTDVGRSIDQRFRMRLAFMFDIKELKPYGVESSSTVQKKSITHNNASLVMNVISWIKKIFDKY